MGQVESSGHAAKRIAIGSPVGSVIEQAHHFSALSAFPLQDLVGEVVLIPILWAIGLQLIPPEEYPFPAHAGQSGLIGGFESLHSPEASVRWPYSVGRLDNPDMRDQ